MLVCVHCRSVDLGLRVAAPAGLDIDGLTAAVHSYAFAPAWMTRLQPLGTEGRASHWNGTDNWPGARKVEGVL